MGCNCCKKIPDDKLNSNEEKKELNSNEEKKISDDKLIFNDEDLKMLQDPKSYQPLTAPLGADGYITSFNLSDDPQSILDFFHKYGFVVVRDVLSETECDATLSEFWARGKESHGLDQSDPNTWADFWKAQKFGKMGIMGNFNNDLESLTQLENRQNEKVYQAFCLVREEKKLWVDHDRLGMMRPTKDINFGDGILKEMEDWRTVTNWLHIDCNPRRGYCSLGSFKDDYSTIDLRKTLMTQSLLTLTNARVEDGGFHCVPGSHKISIKWAIDNGGESKQMIVPKDDPLRDNIQKIPIKKGCLLIWTSLLMHANHPNRSNRFRGCQYLRVIPNSGTPYSPLVPNRKDYPSNFKPSELGEKLFGFKSWD